MSTNYETNNDESNERKSPRLTATRRAFLQVGIGAVGIGALLDGTDNGRLDGSILRGDQPGSAGGDDFMGGYAQNNGDSYNNATETETPQLTETPEPTQTPELTPETTATPETTPTPEATSTPDADFGLDDSSDRMYVQEDGTIVGVDYDDREFRVFSPEYFPQNSELTGLYDEKLEVRSSTDLPADLGTGVRISRMELFSYSPDAYDDMADEKEWDEIWD